MFAYFSFSKWTKIIRFLSNQSFMSNQFTLDHIIQKSKYRCDIIKHKMFIYDIHDLFKGCKNCGNFVCCCSDCLWEFVLGPCFQILFLMTFIVQHSFCWEMINEKESWLLRLSVMWLSVFFVYSAWSRWSVCSLWL